VDERPYPLEPMPAEGPRREGTLIWPTLAFGQEPVVEVGDKVAKKQLLARGETHVYFQANIWVFTVLVFLLGILMGIGSAAVYKHIPDYYPNDVGTVGGIVGVLGGLGGFVSPIIFGYLLKGTGIWTTTWMYLFLLSVTCLTWMHWVIRKMTVRLAPEIAHRIEEPRREPGS
jgi:NNP family nitrate/nitrite transporter-like MFS transporter